MWSPVNFNEGSLHGNSTQLFEMSGFNFSVQWVYLKFPSSVALRIIGYSGGGGGGGAAMLTGV